MMVRALAISFLLHLAILVSDVHESLGNLWGEQQGRGALMASLRERGVNGPAIPVASMSESPGKTSVAEGGGIADANPRRIDRNTEIRHFFPSTAAVANHQPNTQVMANSEDSADVPTSTGAGVSEYRLNLAREARRYKRHPYASSGREAEGVVVISVSVSSPAHWPETRLQVSSGDDGLDRAALEMMEQAVKTASIPLELQNRRFRMAVPVEYRVSD